MIPTIKRALLGLCLLSLTACNSEPASEPVIQVNNSVVSTTLPERIREIARLGTVPLELHITVNGNVVRQVALSNDVPDSGFFEEIANVPADQTNEITLEWFAVPEGTPVLLAVSSTVTSPNQENLRVERYTSIESLDFDGDGISNLQETEENRNILGRYDLEVPFQTSFLGATEELIQGSMDGDTSETEFTPDENTTFSLRHDGTNMYLYVCGQDVDVELDGFEGVPTGYWHDDAVFLYLDGNDSDVEFYDGFDDFQIAFLRQNQEKVVYKGGDDPSVCPNGDCVTHTFTDPSQNSQCLYELNVTMPLAELNITPGTDVGFDLEITDDDNGGLREGSSGFVGFNDSSDVNANTFGKIILR